MTISITPVVVLKLITTSVLVMASLVEVNNIAIVLRRNSPTDNLLHEIEVLVVLIMASILMWM